MAFLAFDGQIRPFVLVRSEGAFISHDRRFVLWRRRLNSRRRQCVENDGHPFWLKAEPPNVLPFRLTYSQRDRLREVPVGSPSLVDVSNPKPFSNSAFPLRDKQNRSSIR